MTKSINKDTVGIRSDVRGYWHLNLSGQTFKWLNMWKLLGDSSLW